MSERISSCCQAIYIKCVHCIKILASTMCVLYSEKSSFSFLLSTVTD